jgi:hypothetical protein
MIKDPVERHRFLQQGQEFLTFLFRRRQGKEETGPTAPAAAHDLQRTG